jgi:Rps23 Pro-64 3,4-dihydroxylase Tpa1-like proline 4-hydroxylase
MEPGGGPPDYCPGAVETGEVRTQIQLPVFVPEYRHRYLRAEPWPHLVLDDVVELPTLRVAHGEALDVARDLRRTLMHRMDKAEQPQAPGSTSHELLEQLRGPELTGFLRQLTGITDLEPDRTGYNGGLHLSAPGAFQDPHEDFRRHPVTLGWHRVNVLLYVVEEWPPDWGGRLELWPRDMRGAPRLLAPRPGRLVIFETHRGTPHGVERVTCPEGTARVSLASFFYSSSPPPGPRREQLLRRPRRPGAPRSEGFVSLREFCWGAYSLLHGVNRPFRPRAKADE